jgi:hypothetical protein
VAAFPSGGALLKNAHTQTVNKLHSYSEYVTACSIDPSGVVLHLTSSLATCARVPCSAVRREPPTTHHRNHDQPPSTTLRNHNHHHLDVAIVALPHTAPTPVHWASPDTCFRPHCPRRLAGHAHAPQRTPRRTRVVFHTCFRPPPRPRRHSHHNALVLFSTPFIPSAPPPPPHPPVGQGFSRTLRPV